MFKHLSDLSKAITFYGIAFGLMVTASLAYPLAGQGVILIAMYTPLIATLVMLLIVTRDGWTKAGWASLGLHRFGLRGWGMAIAVPLVVLGSAYGLVWALRLAEYAPIPEFESVSAWLVPLMIAGAIGLHLVTGALGEELGWRGYLLPRLVSALGRKWGLVVTGLLHGIWHLPIMLLTPLYHADGNLLIIVPLFLAGVVAIGIIEGSLRLSTGSVWPAAILHSTHNVVWDLLRTATVTSSPLVAEYLAGESGIFPVTGYVLIAAAMLWVSLRGQPAPRLGTA